MFLGVEQETVVDTQNKNTEKIIKSYSYCPLNICLCENIAVYSNQIPLLVKGTVAVTFDNFFNIFVQ